MPLESLAPSTIVRASLWAQAAVYLNIIGTAIAFPNFNARLQSRCINQSVVIRAAIPGGESRRIALFNQLIFITFEFANGWTVEVVGFTINEEIDLFEPA